MKLFFRRSMMLGLFLAAIVSTFQTFSGVSAAELSRWLIDQANGTIEDKVHIVQKNKYKQLSLNEKKLPFFAPSVQAMAESVKSDPILLEDVEDWSSYPSKKVVATGYTAGVESTGKDPTHPGYGITYSGVKVKRDLYSTIAADPDVYPIGTVMFIPGYGYGVVADTGSAIKGERIDLYYETVTDVYNEWGKKEVEVYIVKEGTGSLSEDELVQLNEDEAVQVFRNQIAN